MKRVFDVAVVLPALIFLAPVLLLVALAVRLSGRGPVLFKQERMGRNLKPFRILKFRTMVDAAERLGPGVTRDNDPRVTPLGRVLRQTKLDELPQLINVLVGDMSLVGPRPELPRYVERFPEEYREILRVRPGITDPASIAYRDESALIEPGEDSEEQYVRVILPHKLRLSREYVENASLGRDLALILQTVASVIGGKNGAHRILE
jgi:lipopolysaccharide/colanic/teichoic acid biosynthesis glycosyltransferase